MELRSQERYFNLYSLLNVSMQVLDFSDTYDTVRLSSNASKLPLACPRQAKLVRWCHWILTMLELIILFLLCNWSSFEPLLFSLQLFSHECDVAEATANADEWELCVFTSLVIRVWFNYQRALCRVVDVSFHCREKKSLMQKSCYSTGNSIWLELLQY